MSRAVCSRKSVRCAGCSLPPRWCICEGLTLAPLPAAVTVLMHPIEACKPSSTGHLLRRLVPDLRIEVVDRAGPPAPPAPGLAGRETWILHPAGEPAPAAADPARLHLVLLDGSWAQASAMLRRSSGRGRPVRVPAPAQGRFWLRAQPEEGRVSTLEALTALLRHLGLNDEAGRLDDALELHVFAGLLTRGLKDRAAQYKASSQRLARFSKVITRLEALERAPGPPRPSSH